MHNTPFSTYASGYKNCSYDFIGFSNPLNNNIKSHQTLRKFFAQTKALMTGKKDDNAQGILKGIVQQIQF